MTYLASQLITDSYYLSGIVARDLESLSGGQLSDGLVLLNDVIALKTADSRLIPYYTRTDAEFDTVVGQEVYYIENLIEIDPMTFNLGSVRFSMQPMSRREYFGSPRVDNIQSLPFSWHFERVFGGANIYLYFVPNAVYTVKYVGKFSLSDVTEDQDLSLSLDKFYLVYLKFALVEHICADSAITVPPQVSQKLNEIESIITDISPLDLTVEVMSPFQTDGGLNWAYVNFPGWTPG